jgi:FeS assembly SUF system protein
MAFEKLLNLFKEKTSETVNQPGVPATTGLPASMGEASTSEKRNAPAQPEGVVPNPDIAAASASCPSNSNEIENAGPDLNSANPPPDLDELRETIIRQIRTIFDPEIPVNIYDLGLIYEIHINDEREALVRMTLTAPNCPSAEELPVEVDAKVRSIPGITGSRVELVWEPTWNKDMMSEAARLELGM